ncbi:helix-turn-helix domain-containing protein [Streptomyces anulatus]|uniref:helix-turn-helix domain-containing protein n=1 Tax=Streptomyces anulatus TaxID=1892 RepID=UPI0035D6799E
MKSRAVALEGRIAALMTQARSASQEEAAKRRADQAKQVVAAASMERRHIEERVAVARTELYVTQTRLQQLEAAQASIGMAIRLRRHDLKLSAEELSLTTKIKPEIIKAIEAEDYSWRPAGNPKSDVYVCATIRILAKYLGLDADALVELYDREYSSSANEV